MDRVYLGLDLTVDQEFSIEEGELHHLVNVRRAKVGDRFMVVNGKNALYTAELIQIDKKNATARIIEISQKKPSAQIILAQAFTRMNHLEWTIEKGTELGATEFWLFPGLNSEKDELSDNQLKRLTHLTIAAMKQCGRLDLPSIHLKSPLSQWQPLTGTLLYGDPAEEAPYLWDLCIAISFPIVLFIGPEKGFARKEESFLKEHLKATAVRLHPNVLRTETAPLVGLSLIQKLAIKSN